MVNQNLQQLLIIAVNGRYVEYNGQPLCPDAIYDYCRYSHLNEAALSTICVGNYVECPTRKSRVMRGVANFPTLHELRIAQDNKHTRQKIQDSQERKPRIHIGGKF